MVMRTYRVSEFKWRCQGGVLKLTPAQASARKHIIRDLGGGRYELLKACEFREGEEIALDEAQVTPSDLKFLTPTDTTYRVESAKKAARTTVEDILREYPDIADELMERGRREGLLAAESGVEQAVYDRGYAQGYEDARAGLPLEADEGGEQTAGDANEGLLGSVIAGEPAPKKRGGK